ncbi:cellulose synthase family protein [Acidicapsa dinghuensis]|uniref:Cellulose synthase family protein n=1 Tax=Acidicapsa dinghuensis TaxID=2218256 RepID=A0ABW1EIS4_9BACT|nr:cellulose synthase family protein [Acidicapsa dinghuensis]
MHISSLLWHGFQTAHYSAFFAPQNGFRHFLHTQNADKPFRGLYTLNAFDASLLIPYFIVMILLAIYGVHRYQLAWTYFRYRKNYNPEPPQHFAELPYVTVQLPMYNEQFVVDRLIEAVCAMHYPKDKLEIQVLDDSTDETKEVARAIVDRYAALGHPIVYIHRENRHGFKAGALEEGLHIAKGEFIAIFDADFVPPPNWLMKVIHHFAEPEIGMVQTRWGHLNRNYSMLTQIEAILLDGHFVLEHGARARSGDYFNFNGTAGMWRRQAIIDAGGWQHDTLTEDTDLSYRSQLAGWKFKYLPDIECPAELPIEMTAFKTQQARWAKGLIQTSIKVLPVVFRSKAPLRIKIESVYHLTANLSYPLMVIMTALLIPAMIIRFYQGWFQMLLIDFPLFTASTLSIAVFYVMSQRELFPRTWKKTFLYLPFLMAVGIGLTVTNTKAVMEAIFGIKSAFARTPKYSVAKKGEKSKAGKKYRKRLLLSPWIELAIGTYFALAIVYTFINQNYFTAPFLILFVMGYWYTGLMSLFQGRFDRWKSGGANTKDESSPKPFPVGV